MDCVDSRKQDLHSTFRSLFSDTKENSLWNFVVHMMLNGHNKQGLGISAKVQHLPTCLKPRSILVMLFERGGVLRAGGQPCRRLLRGLVRRPRAAAEPGCRARWGLWMAKAARWCLFPPSRCGPPPHPSPRRPRLREQRRCCPGGAGARHFAVAHGESSRGGIELGLQVGRSFCCLRGLIPTSVTVLLAAGSSAYIATRRILLPCLSTKNWATGGPRWSRRSCRF